MSIFDEDLVKKPIPLRDEKTRMLNDDIAKKKRGFIEMPSARLRKEEFRGLLSAMAFSFHEGKPVFMKEFLALSWYRKLNDRNLRVVISPKKPFYEGLNVRMLGAYFQQEDKIELYILNIRDSSNETLIPSRDLLTYVFAHELYHAFFNVVHPNPVVEEPLAEYGALLFSCAFFEKNVCDALLDFVKNKAKVLPHYALGAALFENNEWPSCIIGSYQQSKKEFPKRILDEYDAALKDYSETGNYQESIRLLKELLMY